MSLGLSPPGLMVRTFNPVYVNYTNSTGYSTGTSADANIPQPAQAEVGDLMIALCTTVNNFDTIISPPAGWTEFFAEPAIQNQGSYGYYKVVTQAGAANTPFTWDGNDRWGSQVAVIRGGGQKAVNATIDNFWTGTEAGNDINPPKVFHGSYNRPLVCVHFIHTENKNFGTGASNMTTDYITDNGNLTMGVAFTPHTPFTGGNAPALVDDGFDAGTWNISPGTGWSSRQLVVAVY